MKKSLFAAALSLTVLGAGTAMAAPTVAKAPVSSHATSSPSKKVVKPVKSTKTASKTVAKPAAPKTVKR